jgi:RHS repeat-associated protein
MRQIIRPSLAASIVWGLCAQAFISTGIADIGRTPGSFNVSPTGAATYTIPIYAPPGPNGLQPHITLNYNSHAGNGYLGVGWSLTGLSAISRCNETYAQDSAPAPVTLTYSDRFCIDGKRLMLTTNLTSTNTSSESSLSGYGQNGTTYQTEVADFSNVTASSIPATGNGPSFFTVQGRDGLTYEYGNTSNSANSQVVLGGTVVTWYLDKVTDRAGNTMSIVYASSTNSLTGTTEPTSISWTSTGSSTYAYTMGFIYSASSAGVAGYVAGNAVSNATVLTGIQVQSSGATMKYYALGYTTSATTGRELLTTVTECTNLSQSDCLLPTNISYQGEQSNLSGVGSSVTLVSPQSTPVSILYSNFDLNGDGINDLVLSNNGTIYVAFGSSSGYGTPISTGLTSVPLIGNIDGSGIDSLLVDQSGTWWYYKWNGSSFVGTSTGVALDSTQQLTYLADVNGDGLADLIQGPSGGTLNVRLNTSSNGTVSFASSEIATIPSPTFAGSIINRKLDFYGSGQTDLIGLYEQCSSGGGPPTTSSSCSGTITFRIDLLHFTGSTFSETLLNSGSGPAIVDYADYNNDGCTDVLFQTQLVISACNGSAAQTLALPSGTTAVGGMDWNGDGMRDVLVSQSGTSTVGVVLSTATGLSSSVINTSLTYSSGTSAYVTASNATGDGQDALILAAVNASPYSIQYYTHNSPGAPADLLSSATDGYGNYVNPTYVTLAQGSHTYLQFSDATYPYRNYIGPMYVVNQAAFSDPSGTTGPYEKTYSYFGAWINLQGRGFCGFNDIGISDSRNPLWDVPYYRRDFPYTGMPIAHFVMQSNGAQNVPPVVQISNTVASVTLDSTANNQRYFPSVTASSTSTYEYGGTENAQLITASSSNYTYDNFGNLTASSTTVTDEDPNSPYDGKSWTKTVTNATDVDINTWCLPLSTQIQVGYSTTNPAEQAVTNTQVLTPDLNNCRYTQVLTQAANSKYNVTSALSYDGFGNISSVQVTGAGMATRTSTVNWGTTGQFPTLLQDASGAKTLICHDPRWGLTTSVTDPSGVTDTTVTSSTCPTADSITTTSAYDGFGRLSSKTHPDGTFTTWSYQDCANDGGCIIGAHGLVTNYGLYNNTTTVSSPSNSALISSGMSYDDPVGRTLFASKQLLGNSATRVDFRYDNLGRRASQSIPCTASSNPTTACTPATTYTYDFLNRLTLTDRPISSGGSASTSYSYAGRTTKIQDADGNTTTRITDVNGWLRQTIDANSPSYAVSLSYDAEGNATAATDGTGRVLRSASYVYGIGAFPTSSTDARGSWSYTPDALGEVTSWNDTNGKSFSALYDPLSRITDRFEQDLYTHWTYGSTQSSDNVGKLQCSFTYVPNGGTFTSNPSPATGCSPTNGDNYQVGYSEADSYDTLGRLTTRSIAPTQMQGFNYSYQYDPHTGLLSTLTYPSNAAGYALQLAYGYTNGILSSITDVTDNNVNLWTLNSLNPAGQVSSETLGNGTTSAHTYDPVTALLTKAVAGLNGGTASQNQGFQYDNVGNITQRQDNNLGLTENLYYDNDYHLKSSTLNGTQNLSVSYNPDGGIASKTDPGPNLQSYTATYTSYNLPSTISAAGESVSFAYGPNRERIEQIYNNGGTETSFYVGGLFEQVFAAGSGVEIDRYYVYGGGKPVAVVNRSGTNTTISYVLTDHQASMAAITTSTGATDVAESFSAFGVRRNPSTWSGAASSSDLSASAAVTRQGYTFQTTLGQFMGMSHMNGRVQDAITGRFLSPDPVLQNPADSQSYNAYAYTRSNPLTYVDPSGFVSTRHFPYEEGVDAQINDDTFSDSDDPLSPGGDSSSDLGAFASQLMSAALLQWLNAVYNPGGVSAFQTGFNGSAGDALAQGVPTDIAATSSSASGCAEGCMDEVDMDAARILVPNNNFLPPQVQGSFSCGTATCSYQMGLYNYFSGGGHGVWILVNMEGRNLNGQWVQTYISGNNTGILSGFATDWLSETGAPFPFYGSQYSGSDYFFDDPGRANYQFPVIWVAQTTYVPSGGSSGGFTMMWGWGGNSYNSIYYIPPTVVSPWPSQALCASSTVCP